MPQAFSKVTDDFPNLKSIYFWFIYKLYKHYYFIVELEISLFLKGSLELLRKRGLFVHKPKQFCYKCFLFIKKERILVYCLILNIFS